MNELTAPSDIQENDIYIFANIGNVSYAFPALSVLEIIKLTELEYPEKMPSYIAGLLEYQGKIIHIIDLRTILNVETKEYDVNTHILVIKGKNANYGIISDEITDIRKIDIKTIAPPPNLVSSLFTKGIYLNQEKNATVIDLNALENWMETSASNGESSFSQKAARLLPRDINSKEILHQRKLQLVEKTKKAGYPALPSKDIYISFLIGNSTYCLEIGHVGGFYKYSDTMIIKVPCTPDFVQGLISIKGDYFTIIDLKKYFDNEPSEITDKSTIIALQSKDFRIGFIVDEISSTMDIPSNLLYKTKSEVTEYVKDDKLYLVLNVTEILNNEKLYIG